MPAGGPALSSMWTSVPHLWYLSMMSSKYCDTFGSPGSSESIILWKMAGTDATLNGRRMKR